MKYILLALFVFLSISSFSRTIFVSQLGSDENGNGSINMPLLTLGKALGLAQPGTTIYLRGGIYNFSTTFIINKSGSAGKYITISAYQNETVVFDFAEEPYKLPNLSPSRGIEIDKGYNYIYIKNLIIKNAADNGIYIGGNNNIIENCTVSFCHDTGIQISSPGSYNYIHNCDAHDNSDSLTGGQNADGIDVKLNAGPGNVLRGCRCYDNADDGYDFFQTDNKVIVDSCWAFHNGYNLWNIQAFTGNGNGFKLGGNFVTGHHVVTNCISFDNVVKGFDQNNNTGGITLYNCTGFRNGTYNFSFPTSPLDGTDTMKNNISYLSGKGGSGINITSNSVQKNNSWNGFSFNGTDFISLDTSLARTLRLADGSLPITSFLRLKTESALVDAGVPVGIPYVGTAPDLGAFEFNTENTTQQSFVLGGAIVNKSVHLNWVDINEIAHNGWVLQRASQISATSFSDWKDLLTVPTMGLGINLIHTYDTIDNIIQYGAYIYRLKQTDVSGTIRYSNSVEFNISNTTLPFVTTVSVFPNPFESVFYIKFFIPSPKVVQVALMNSKGQMISTIVNHYYTARGTYYVPNNGSTLATGMYYLKFIADDGISKVIPLLKTP